MPYRVEATLLQQMNNDLRVQEHRFEVEDCVMIRKDDRNEQGVAGELNWNWKGLH